MPELPEAETIVRGLRPHLTGRTIREVRVLRPDLVVGSSAEISEQLAGRVVSEVGRRGKNIVLRLDDGVRGVVNLGMTGRLLVADPEASPPLHPGLRCRLDSGAILWYDDTRRFGRIEVMSLPRWRGWSGTLGPEPLSASYTSERMARELARSASPVRSWLLDQRRVAGVGNIYASEALHGARIHPLRAASSLTREEASRLHRSLRRVLRAAIRYRGTTLRDYRDPLGREGGNAQRLRAYGRDGQPCLRCRATVERIVFSNRSAFFCPRCQPAPGGAQ
jgi:formamidopyrimidine-DNA glycosylase